MTNFQAKYTDDQRAAVAHTYAPHVRSARAVAELAAAGRLRTPDGAPVKPFQIPEASVRDIARDHRRRALAETQRAPIAAAEHRDAVEALRIRLMAVADEELRALERAKPGHRNVEKARQVGRLIREAAALPARDDPAPPTPGAKVNGEREGGETRGGLAGAILQSHRASNGSAPAPEPPSESAPAPAARADDAEVPLGERLRDRIGAHLADHLAPPPAPPRPRDPPTRQSAPHLPEEVPPGTARDRIRRRLPDEDASSIR